MTGAPCGLLLLYLPGDLQISIGTFSFVAIWLTQSRKSDPLLKMVNVYHNEEEDFLLRREAWLHFC